MVWKCNDQCERKYKSRMIKIDLILFENIKIKKNVGRM